MTTPELPPPLALFRMVTGYYVSRAIYVAAELGIADLLAQGSRHYEELAKEEDGRFALTPLGQHLRDGVPGSMRAVACLFGGRTQDAWTGLLDTVRTGDPAFRRSGQPDPFASMAADPEQAALFDEAMADWTKQVAVAAATCRTWPRAPRRVSRSSAWPSVARRSAVISSRTCRAAATLIS